MARSRHKVKRLETYGTGKSTPVYDELRQKPAYHALTPQERLVLLDMIRIYCRASGWDTKDISDTGFTYTYAQCDEHISHVWFYKAIKRICKIGFFASPPHIQELKPAAPRRFVPSTAWRRYEPTAEEIAKMRKFDADKERHIVAARKRRVDFRTGLPRRNTKKRGISKFPDTKVTKFPDTVSQQAAHKETEFPDTAFQNGAAEVNKLSRLNTTIEGQPVWLILRSMNDAESGAVAQSAQILRQLAGIRPRSARATAD